MARTTRRRAGIEARAALWTARHPTVVLAPGLALTCLAELGPITTGSITGGAVLAGIGWMRSHPASFDRYAAPHLRAFRRRWTAYVGWRWTSTMQACDLAKDNRRTGAVQVPRVVRVASTSATIDRITVRLLKGQSLRTWVDKTDELAAALNAEALAVTRIKPQVLVLTVIRSNPFVEPVEPAPIPDETTDVDFSRVELGELEDGDTWAEPLLGHHWLVSGATGSGKSSLLWNPLRQLGPAIRDGVVRVWMVDPKGGMETSRARSLFHRWADHIDDEDGGGDDNPQSQGEAALDLIESFRDAMKARQAKLSADGDRKFAVSTDTPVEVLMVDELAMLTALGSSTRALNKLLAVIMTQGRAVGFSVCAYVQEPTKDIVPIRELFTRRISLRTTTASYVDMVLGDEARQRGALADEIPADEEHAGIGYRVDDKSRTPIRVRAGHTTDADIDELVRTCTPPVDNGGMGQLVPFPTAS